jgi:DNA-directed RNA polymerase
VYYQSTTPTIYAINKQLFDTFQKILVKLQSENKNKETVDVSSIKTNHAKPKEAMTLYERQLQIEEEQRSAALSRQAEMFANLKQLGKGTSVKRVQRNLVNWYEPLQAALNEEIRLIESGVSGEDRSKYGPYLLLLPVHQIAILALDTTVSAILRSGNAGVPTTSLTLEIGNLIETEVNLAKVKMSKEHSAQWAKRLLKDKPRESIQLYRKLKKIMKDIEGWSWDTKVKIGAVIVKLLLNSVRNEKGENIFLYTSSFVVATQKKQGIIKISPESFNELDSSKLGIVLPRFLPMLVPPQPWNNRDYYGAYFRLKAPLMKHTSKSQMDATRKADMKPVLEGLDYLGKTAWRINSSVYDVVMECRERGLRIGELPSNNDLDILPKDEFFEKYLNDGNFQSKATDPDQMIKEKEAMYRQWCSRVEKKNAELHSLRCDIQIKLSIADQFLKERMYFPHNLDFRGRAYPIPPNLSHLGSDMCRALLLFDDGKVLGHAGLRWLKIHLANLCGHNKVSFDSRVAWAEAHWEEIKDSAQYPLSGNMWWAKAESPFQALATCIELTNAMKLDDPTQYTCRLPVHQDGSCNGLQHYAGLGRDKLGGKAVNLMPSDSPQDVYSRVLEVVLRHIDEDTKIPEDTKDPKLLDKRKYAIMVKDMVNRKVIKQTVMTSVYGVTKIGARQQVQARLTELYAKDAAVLSATQEKELYWAANYVAGLTLLSLHEMFDSAKKIMDWLAVVSHLVSQQVRRNVFC